jgi:ABC-type polysaccharide/polyol phosphate export permease
MTAYLGAIWQCRCFWLSLVRMDLRTRYRRSVLGMGWSLLNPIAMTVILCAVFHTIFHQPISDYAPYLLAGLATWNYLLHVTQLGCGCFAQGESYIRQYPAPLAIYPLRTALGGTIHFILALLVALVASWCFKGIGSPASLLSLIPAVLLLFIFVWSTALLAGLATVHFQDTQHLSEVGFQILYYATPIMYKIEQLEGTKLAGILGYNPLLAILRLIRDPLVEHQVPSATTYLVACTTILTTALLAGTALAKLQRRLIFYL